MLGNANKVQPQLNLK